MIHVDFKVGDLVRHKATGKKCVISQINPDGWITVTTQDDDVRNYRPEELEPYTSRVGVVKKHLY